MLQNRERFIPVLVSHSRNHDRDCCEQDSKNYRYACQQCIHTTSLAREYSIRTAAKTAMPSDFASWPRTAAIRTIAINASNIIKTVSNIYVSLPLITVYTLSYHTTCCYCKESYGKLAFFDDRSVR